MTNWTTLPHERLIAFQVARKLLLAVSEAKISDPKLRDQALRAAKSTCLNIAEAVGRVGEADKARVFAIASPVMHGLRWPDAVLSYGHPRFQKLVAEGHL
jgi:hypothetical protein